MKTNSILLLLCIILLSSCAGKFGVMKRRYNKGFYVSVTGDRKPSQNQVRRETKQITPRVEEQAAARHAEQVRDEQVQVAVQAAVIHKNQAVASHAAAADLDRRSSLSTNISANAGITRPSVFKAKSLAKEMKSQLRSAENKGSDVNAILLVVLCLLIPPLAVYLFHNALNADFWLSLILTLLFWVPGVIWAFLVCFAGVSIA